MSEREPERPTVFFADPVDSEGNVIASAWLTNVTVCGEPVQAVKIPYDEIVLDPERTIHVDLTDLGDEPTEAGS